MSISKASWTKSIALFLVVFLVGTTTSFAQHDHGSQGQTNHGAQTATSPEIPHGGMAKKAGKYVIEMVVNMLQREDKVTIYLLNANAKTLRNKDVSGTIHFTFEDGTSRTDALTPRGDNRFVAQLSDLRSFTAEVSLKVKGKDIGAMFQHGGMGGHDGASSYSCPMHADVVSHSPGSCSKCGMALKKVN